MQDDAEEDEDDAGMIEVQLVPQDKTSLDDIFGAMNQAQKMHPDPNDSPLSGKCNISHERDIPNLKLIYCLIFFFLI